MSKFSGALAALAVSALPVATLVAAPAEAAGTARQTLMSRTYTCDRQPINYMKFRFPAVPTAEITSDGRTATAHIEMLDGARNAQYTVRVIPAPHASFASAADAVQLSLDSELRVTIAEDDVRQAELDTLAASGQFP